MKVRRTGLATVGAAFALAALVAVIGAAQAAPSTKVYSATVNVANGQFNTGTGNATLRLTLKNESKNTLGSADFDPLADVTFLANVFATSRTGWTAQVAGGAVQFRSTSSATALTKGQSVSADVPVDVSGCTDANWATKAKQSNDFSGNPGNDFQRNDSLSNLRPLGSFTFDPIGTPIGDEFYPQIVVSEDEEVTVTAYDICGEIKESYASANPGNYGDDSTLDRDPLQEPERLAGAVPLELGWESGVGSATLTPLVVEAADRLVVTDAVSGISANSDAGTLDDFDVVETICISDTTCHWENSNNKIRVDAPAPPDGASLGVGFSTNLSSGFSCNEETDAPLGGTIIYVNPRGYELGEKQSVTFTYDKTIQGTSGPVTNFQLCISKDNGEHWLGPILDCGSDPPVATDAPCVQDRGRSNGDLFVILFLDPTVDPAGGMT